VAKPYPINSIEEKRTIVSSMGSFWTSVFKNSDYLASLISADADLTKQTLHDYNEIVDSLSVYSVPLTRYVEWIPINISTNDEEQLTANQLTYGEGGVYGPQTDGAVYLYGAAAVRKNFRYFIGIDVNDIAVITNAISEPTLTLVNGIDFKVEDGFIVFKINPFDNELITKRYSASDGSYACSLWLNHVKFDKQYVYNKFGSLLGVSGDSTSQWYRLLTQVLFSSKVDGSSKDMFSLLLSAVTNTLFAIDGEIVRVIDTEDPDRLVIVTDFKVYAFHKDATPLVAVGDILIEGQPLVDTVQVFELSTSTGVDDAIAEVPAISLDSKFISGDFTGELVFENKTVTLDYEGLDEGNRAVVTFEVSGYDADIDLFWDTVHTNGVQAGKVLADYLDKRTVKNGPPLPSHLPSTVNPMEFVLENIMRNNLTIVKLKPLQVRDTSILKYIRLLRKFLPPHTTLIMYIELSGITDSVDLGNSGTTTSLGVSETTSNFLGAFAEDTCYELSDSPVGDVLTYTDNIVTIKSYAGLCAK